MPKNSKKRVGDDASKMAAEAEKLRARAKTQEAKTAKWKKRAKRFEAESLKNAKQLARLKKKLRKCQASKRDEGAETVVVEPVDVATVETPSANDVPDESWTVARLRNGAREAAVPGYSRMTKAALLDALTQSPAG